MGSRRGSDEAPLSLISFQDIVTSLSGIMILVVMLFIVEASKLKETPPPPPGAVDRTAEINNLRSQLTQLQAMAKAVRDAQTVQTLKDRQKALEARISDLIVKLTLLREQNDCLASEIASNATVQVALRKEIKNKQETDSIRFLAGPGSKAPVLIVCSGVDVQCLRLSAAVGPKVFSAGALGELNRHITQNIDSTRQCLVLMLKPSSASYASGLIKNWQNAGYDVGWDALEEEKRINLGLE